VRSRVDKLRMHTDLQSMQYLHGNAVKAMLSQGNERHINESAACMQELIHTARREPGSIGMRDSIRYITLQSPAHDGDT
jgi:hypothetical protein